jgi:predicted DNA-binding transcriptional regulator AlpA
MEDEMANREVLNEREVWEEYGFTIPFLRRARRERRGPRFMKVGKMVRYRRADIEAYLVAHAVETHEPAQRA